MINAKNVLIENIEGVGKKTADKFRSFGVYSAKDLLLYFPTSYSVYEPISLNEAKKHLDGVCLAGICNSPVKYTYYNSHLSSLIFTMLTLDKEEVKVIVFNRTYLNKMIKVGTKLKIYGRYNKYRNEISAQEVFVNTTSGHIKAKYDTKEIPAKTIMRYVNFLIKAGVRVEEYLPSYILARHNFLELNEMIYHLHNPSSLKEIDASKQRRKYEEILDFYLRINKYKEKRQHFHREAVKYDIVKVKELIDSIPFELTSDQKEVCNQVFRDLKKDVPMNRIIQGDVGSGKTIVALILSYAINTAKKQVVLMAPTEILASQHLNYFNKYLYQFGINVALLTSSCKAKEKKEILDGCRSGKIDILIGTHALFYEDIIYHDLGLAIIDEQHRFGVNARNKLLNNKENIDALYLSATPIPRTLSLTLFNDLDISTIKSKRLDKGDIITKIYKNEELNKVFDLIEKELDKGHQGYFVVSSIESEYESTRFDIDEVKSLLEIRFENKKIAYLHGKMKDVDKNKIMQSYLNKEIDIIVSTTVIEVGISVDNATFMVVLDAQNFGLSTLHQLRGRVGRANLTGYCYLLANDLDIERLNVLEESNDGFYLSEMDLKLRGPGDYFGYRQSGMSDFVFADFNTDLDLFRCCDKDAKELLILEEHDYEIHNYISAVLAKLDFSDKLN